MDLFILLILLFAKHLWIDFLWQLPYEYKNKGKLFAWGGISHSLKHALVTFIVLNYAGLHNQDLFLIVAAEFFIHYFVDYTKVNLNAHYELTQSDPAYWYLLGIDQFLHALTYIAIAWAYAYLTDFDPNLCPITETVHLLSV